MEAERNAADAKKACTVILARVDTSGSLIAISKRGGGWKMLRMINAKSMMDGKRVETKV